MTDIADKAAAAIRDKLHDAPSCGTAWNELADIIRKTYTRTRHDGDCYWWTCKVCTCGFFHQQISEAKHSKDIAVHLGVLDRVPQG